MSDLFIFERGRDDFRKNRPRPPYPGENDTGPAAIRWYGWMVERAMEIMKRIETRRKLGLPDD